MCLPRINFQEKPAARLMQPENAGICIHPEKPGKNTEGPKKRFLICDSFRGMRTTRIMSIGTEESL